MHKTLARTVNLWYNCFGSDIMKLKIVLEKGKDGYIVVHCPSLKGCWTQGKTEKEAIKNIKEAIALYLEPKPKEVKPTSNHKILELAI